MNLIRLISLFFVLITIRCTVYRTKGIEAAVLSSYRNDYDARNSNQHTHLLFHLRVTTLLKQGDFISLNLNHQSLNLALVQHDLLFQLVFQCQILVDRWIEVVNCKIEDYRVMLEMPQDLISNELSISVELRNQLQVGSLSERSVGIDTYSSRMHLLDNNPVFGLIPWHRYQYMAPRLHILSITTQNVNLPLGLVKIDFKIEINHGQNKLRLVLSSPWKFEQNVYKEITPQILEIDSPEGEFSITGIRNPQKGEGTCWIYSVTGLWGMDREAELVKFKIDEIPLVVEMKASERFYHNDIHVIELKTREKVQVISVKGGDILEGSLYQNDLFIRMRVKIDNISDKLQIILDDQVVAYRYIYRKAQTFLQKVYYGSQQKDKVVELDDLNDGNIKLELDIKDEIIDLNQDKLEITLDWIELNNNFDCNGRQFALQDNKIIIEGPFTNGQQEIELRHLKFGDGSSENYRDYEISVKMNNVMDHRLLMVEKKNGFNDLIVSQSRTMRDYFIVRLIAKQQTPKIISIYGISQGICSQECRFVKGVDNFDVNDGYFLDWDRVHIVVDDQVSEYHVGVIDYSKGGGNNYKIVLNEQVDDMQYRSEHYKGLITLTDPSRPLHSIKQRNNNYLDMYGYAGSLANIDLYVESTSSHKRNDNNNYGAAIIIDTYWQIWYQQISSMVIQSVYDEPLNFNVDGRSLLYIPYNHDYTTLQLQDVYYPYSYDLQTYFIYITDKDGGMDTFKNQYNPGSNMFYSKVLEQFSFECDDNSQGSKNSWCVITFKNNYRIPQQCELVIRLKNMKLYTNEVTLNGVKLQAIPNSSNDIIQIVLLEQLNVQEYTLQLSGLEIIEGQLEYLIDFELKDYNFVIEYHQRLFVTSSKNDLSIVIYELFYEYVNSDVFSSSRMKFKIPRSLKLNEQFYLYLGSDLTDQNQHIQRLIFKLSLIQDDQTYQPIPIFSIFNGKEFNIQLDQPLEVGNYQLEILGIRIPAGNANDLFQLKYVRDFDLGVTLINSYDSTVQFPQILDGYIGDISINSEYQNMGGIVNTLIIRFNKIELNLNTQIQIYFPIYYSPSLSTMDNLICRVNKQPISCVNDLPYRLLISQTTLLISSSQQFDITIDGIDSPSYYQDDKESLFIAIIQDQSQNQYQQYIHLQPPQIQQVSQTFNYIIVTDIMPSQKFTKAISDHQLTLIFEQTLPLHSIISIQFPSSYTTIHLSSNLFVYSDNQLIGEAFIVGQWIQFTLLKTVQKGTYQWTITNIPTPEKEVNVDFNHLLIHCYYQNLLLSTSFPQLNQVQQKVSFKEDLKILSVNDNKIFQVVRGTYSRELQLYQTNENRFISNIRIQGQGEGFKFIPDIINIHIGEFSQPFRIGVDYEMIPQIYWFDIQVLTVTGPYIMQDMLDLKQRLLISVLPGPIIISVPSIMKLPQGGCTLPFFIEIQDSPIEQLQIISFSNLVEFDLELSTDILNYTSTIKTNYISYCSNHTDKVQLSLLGDLSYALSQSIIKIEVDNDILDTIPLLQVSVIKVGRTSVSINTVSNVVGVIYWELSTATPKYNLKQLKLLFKYRETVIDEYNHYIGIHVQDQLQSQFTIPNLMPQTNYNLCHYQINQHKSSIEEKVCIEFKTTDWQPFLKASVHFSKSINLDSLNTLICSMVIKAQTKINNLIDSHGQSCSLALKPLKLYLPEIDYGNQELTTNFYLIPDSDLENDQAITIFKQELEKDQIIQDLNHLFNIDFIQSLTYQFTFSYSDAINKKNRLEIADIKNKKFELFHTKYVSSILLKDLQLTKDGQVYFILEKIKTVDWDYLWLKKVYHELNKPTKPEPHQIEQCQNAQQQQVSHCLKAIITGDSKVDIEFVKLEKNTVYMIYFVVATEFPLRSVLGETVYAEEFETDFQISGIMLLNALLILYIQ